MLGIENLKKAVILGVDLGNQAAISGADGWGWLDSFSFLDELIQIPGVIAKGDEIVAELKDLDEAETAELHQLVKDRLDIPNDHTEKIVEDALLLVLTLVRMVYTIRAAKAANTGESPSE